MDLFRPVDNSQGPPYEIGYGENQWPETPGSFRQVSEKYIDAVLSLAMEVVKAISIGLEVDETEILSRLSESFWNLRILGYKAAPKTENEAVSGIGNHTGNSCQTFLVSNKLIKCRFRYTDVSSHGFSKRFPSSAVEDRGVVRFIASFCAQCVIESNPIYLTRN